MSSKGQAEARGVEGSKAVPGPGAGSPRFGRKLRSGSSVEIVLGAIEAQRTEAVVTATDPTLARGGLIDLAVRRAAGPALDAARRQVIQDRGGALLEPGNVVITEGQGLPAAHVIHCVLPRYNDDPSAGVAGLVACYREAIALARRSNLRSIAFPSIGTGLFGYPVEIAVAAAVAAVGSELETAGPPLAVRFVLVGPGSFDVYRQAMLALPGE